MKNLVLCMSLIGLLMASQTASADGRRGNRGYVDWGYGNHFYGGHNYHRSAGYYGRAYNPYHYGYRNRRAGNYIGLSFGSYYPRYRYRHYDTGSFVGGLVLGSLLSYPRYSHRHYDTVTYRRSPVTRTRQVIVRESQGDSSAPVASGRRLLRDLEGNCFERIIDEDGNEVRIQLDASECEF